MTIRERLEEAERRILHPRAAFAADSRGRARPEPDDDLRTVFQRDRDRILHAKSFRRLKGKTQVFLAPVGDHYRTRLTHTLEVAQVGRTIARALFLNESLVEAIVMGHDLGHTPFGHAGESTLRRILPGGFHHVRQSLRVVDVLEREGRGLNLTAEVRDGILRHTKGKGAVLVDGGEPLTLEAEIVRIADIVAYVCHDLDDALRAGVVRTWSTGSLGRLFPVRDRFVSWWNPATRLAVQSRLDALEKGESRRLRIRFRRYPGGAALAEVESEDRHGSKRLVSTIDAKAQDVVAAVFWLRCQTLRPGERFSVPVFTGKKSWRLGADVVGVATLETPLGAFPCVHLKLRTSFEGNLTSLSDLDAWFSADARHLPVRLDASLLLGRLQAELIRVEE